MQFILMYARIKIHSIRQLVVQSKHILWYKE